MLLSISKRLLKGLHNLNDVVLFRDVLEHDHFDTYDEMVART